MCVVRCTPWLELDGSLVLGGLSSWITYTFVFR